MVTELGPATLAVGVTAIMIDERPTVVVDGAVPFCRSLGLDDSGRDVVELQQFLITGGWYAGEADRLFGVATRSGVRRWQEALGLAPSGIVELGDVLALTDPASRVRFTVEFGDVVGAGDSNAETLADVPSFTVRIAGSGSPDPSSASPSGDGTSVGDASSKRRCFSWC